MADILILLVIFIFPSPLHVKDAELLDDKIKMSKRLKLWQKKKEFYEAHRIGETAKLNLTKYITDGTNVKDKVFSSIMRALQGEN